MILVTGGAGFIGSNVVHALIKQGHDVAVMDSLGNTHKWKNLQGVRIWKWYQPDQIDLVLAQKPSAVVHMGAISSTTATDGDQVLQSNFALSQQLAAWCWYHRISFVYASSASTYGNGNLGFDDNHALVPLLKPMNLYGWSKQLFDLWMLEFSRKNHMVSAWAGLKFFNVYGPREQHKQEQSSVIFQQWQRLSQQASIKLFKSTRPGLADGEQKRDFVYVMDAVDVVLWCLNNPQVQGLFNVGSGTASSFNQVAQQLISHVAEAPGNAIEYVNMPSSLVQHYQNYTCAPIAKLRSAGYTKPMTDLEQGVEAYVEWLKHNQL